MYQSTFLVAWLAVSVLGCAGGPVASPPSVPSPPAGALDVRAFKPKTQANLRKTAIERPSVPTIDAHTHLGPDDPAVIIAQMDAGNVRGAVILGPGQNQTYAEMAARWDRAFPGRFATLTTLGWPALVGEGGAWGDKAREALAKDVAAGAKGLKIFKDLGLTVRTPSGARVGLDDPELDKVFAFCEAEHVPIMWHVADPAAFFDPVDATNERWLEIGEFPEWSFSDRSKFPTRETLFAEQERVLSRHPNLVVIGAHMASLAEDLEALDRKLVAHPNLYVDIAASINELGRQPYSARRLFEKHQDRILFGMDRAPANRNALKVYARFLETDDEYFDTSGANGVQGHWNVYGLALSKEILQKVYAGNAVRVFRLSSPSPTANP